MLHAALERIDATPAQERFIVAELDKLTPRRTCATTREDLGLIQHCPHASAWLRVVATCKCHK